MAIVKCKMCGGDIVLNEEKTFGTCEYCGSTMTLPKVSDDQRAARFNRGNHFRRQGEFDKALGVYESIVREDDTDAEAHWCCALCRFGIEYVEDPNTFEFLPTCHRASFDSFLEDVDYLAALEYSDGITKRQYRKDAVKIAEVQKGILATSQNEKPFDVFICYKETDDQTKERTRDSIDAQEIYYQLTQEGYRVFFSRITLEDKVGTEYEPYIFAALNSAKVMLAIGSKPEYFNAVWVKNEWSRFLAMMRKDRSKLLLPCYKGMDPYDLPEQLGVLQSYDMTKIGFMQDLIRGVKKVLRKDEPKPATQQVIVRETGGGPNVGILLKRGNMALEDGQWERAREFFDQVLNYELENAEAYLGLVMANARLTGKEAFREAYTQLKVQESPELRRAKLYMKQEEKSWWKELEASHATAVEQARLLQMQQEEEAERRKQEERKRRLQLSAGQFHSLGVKEDGTVLFTGLNRDGQCKVSDWTNIVSVSAGYSHSVGVRKDGTVVAVGSNYSGKRNVSGWQSIVAVAAGEEHTVGLKTDGTVVATEYKGNLCYYFRRCEVSDWQDIQAIAVGQAHTVGLKSNGTVIATGLNNHGQCNTSSWKNVVAITAGQAHTVGLKSDGTVIATRYEGQADRYRGQCEVSGWCDIVAIAAGNNHTVGLKADGTVVATVFAGNTDENSGQCDVSEWRDIIAIAAGNNFTLGLKNDGTVIATGNKGGNRCDVENWKLFKDVIPI